MLLLKEVNVLLIRYFIVLKTFLNLVQIVLTSSDLVYSIYSLFSVFSTEWLLLLVADCYHLDDCLHNRWFQTHGDSEQRVRIRTEHRLSVQRL